MQVFRLVRKNNQGLPSALDLQTIGKYLRSKLCVVLADRNSVLFFFSKHYKEHTLNHNKVFSTKNKNFNRKLQSIL